MLTVDPVSENVMKLPPSQRRTVRAARRLVQSAAPMATEVAARSRSIPSASHTKERKIVTTEARGSRSRE